MATITTNDHAPDEVAKYILPLETFDLGPGDSFETENRNTISNAESHPWLEVEYPELEELGVARESKSVPASEDAYSADGPLAHLPFDPEQIRKDNAEAQVVAPVAIESGLDQGESVESGRVAVTLAAADDKVAEAEAEIKAANDDSKPKSSKREG